MPLTLLTPLTPLTLRLFCAAGAELGDPLLSAGLLESLTSMTPLMPQLFAWQTRRLATVCRGLLDAVDTADSVDAAAVCVADVALGDSGGLLDADDAVDAAAISQNMGPNSPPPQPRCFVSCYGRVPSIRLLHPLHDKPWSFANTVGLELCATYVQWRCQQALEGKRRHGILMVFWANKILFHPLRKRNVNRSIKKTTSN